MSKFRDSKSASTQKIAEERIEILFREAERQIREHPERANRYVFLARKIAMRYNVKIPKELKRKFCHKCHHYFLLGKNCKVRTNPETKCVEYKCLDCGRVNRYGYSLEKAEA